MTTEHEMAIAIATEIGKQAPVKQAYEDSASPAMRQVGATFEDVVKCIRLVGFPIQWLAVQQDRFRASIERAKSQIPEERLVLPAPAVLGPILESFRYRNEEDPVSQMFEELLSRSMDSDRLWEAHRAFISMLSRISAGEAQMLNYLRLHRVFDSGPQQSERAPNFADFRYGYEPIVKIPNEVGLTRDNFDLCYLNLHSLGLVVYKSYTQRDAKTGVVTYGTVMQLEPLGQRLVRACTPNA